MAHEKERELLVKFKEHYNKQYKSPILFVDIDSFLSTLPEEKEEYYVMFLFEEQDALMQLSNKLDTLEGAVEFQKNWHDRKTYIMKMINPSK